MGTLVDGEWQQGPVTSSKDGRYARQPSQVRHWVTRDGSAGPSGEAGFPAEMGRYHLYVSLACPWASRTTMMRHLKGLEDAVSLSVVHWHMGDQGWTFDAAPCATGDALFGARYLHEIYTAARPDYTGRVSVPVLWDKVRSTMVSNESADILRMFNDAFDHLGALAGDYYPVELRGEIDRVNERVYQTVNNGVYRAGFATSQEAHEEAVGPLFETLDWLEEKLTHSRYLVGDRLTEADLRLFTTLVRFDAVYHGNFKCNLRRIVDYPALWRYTRQIYALPGVSDTVNFEHIKKHYYGSHRQINPTGVVPVGPSLDFTL